MDLVENTHGLIDAEASPVPELFFLPTPYRGSTRASERRVQDNLHAHAQNDAIFSPKSGEKPYLEVLSRFGLWRDFLNDNIQATISAFRLIPNQWNFTSATLAHIRFVFYYNIKENERNLCQDLLTIENTDSDLKVHALHYANELLVRGLSLTFAKSLNIQKQYQKNVWEKSNDAYSLSTRVQSTINHRFRFFACKLSWTLLSLARVEPLYRGGKKGKFRDWTMLKLAEETMDVSKTSTDEYSSLPKNSALSRNHGRI